MDLPTTLSNWLKQGLRVIPWYGLAPGAAYLLSSSALGLQAKCSVLSGLHYNAKVLTTNLSLSKSGCYSTPQRWLLVFTAQFKSQSQGDTWHSTKFGWTCSEAKRPLRAGRESRNHQVASERIGENQVNSVHSSSTSFVQPKKVEPLPVTLRRQYGLWGNVNTNWKAERG